MRVRKTPAELDMMREAARITTCAYDDAVSKISPGPWEYEVEAALDYGFRANGGDGPAYTPIVASDANATVLHYRENWRRMGDGDLVLIDAAASYGHYSCDVSRTYPVDGSFTPSQRRVYEIVLQAQKAVIGAVQAGTTLKDVHRFGAMALIQGMIKLGWLEDGPPEELLKERAHRTCFPHAIGDYLGLDTHDVGPIVFDDKHYPLEEGVVFTVEPGIYVPSDAEGALAEYAGIGVRIEDSVIVQAGGCEVLTSQIPKDLEEVESRL